MILYFEYPFLSESYMEAMFPHPRACLPSVLLTSRQGDLWIPWYHKTIVLVAEIAWDQSRGKKQSETAKK